MVILLFVTYTPIKLIFKNIIKNIFLQMDYTFKREKKYSEKNGVKIVKDMK